jgi:hypothetical protein
MQRNGPSYHLSLGLNNEVSVSPRMFYEINIDASIAVLLSDVL